MEERNSVKTEKFVLSDPHNRLFDYPAEYCFTLFKKKLIPFCL